LATRGQASHVLVIDDDHEVLEMLNTILTLDGYRVTVCDNGDEGIKLAEEERPDVIVLDVVMPDKSGIEVMKEIRDSQAIKHIPILFLSAVGDQSVVVEGLKGADDYVLKPFRTLELEARISKVLSRTLDSARDVPPLVGQVPERLAVHVGNETYLVPLEQVIYFEASGKYAYAITRNKRFLTNFSIGELEQKLANAGRFLRVHRSHIVNTDAVFKIARDAKKNLVVVMSDEAGTELRVSESYLREVKRRLGI
jgi:two-component system, LytTR family, response regulator